jgi:glycosyltransferase involved in cell wall biosynthesis
VPDDIKEIVCRKPGAFIILYIGRFDSIKITEDKLPLINLIHAGKISKQKDMNFHVLYIGDGDDHIKRNMLGLINQHDLQNYVTLLGPKTNVFDYIKFSHLGVGGIAINAVSQEYTISGKAQILMKVKVNADTPWCHGVNAIFVKPDDPVDLAEKIIWAIKNPEQLKKIGENAKEDMKNYIVDSKFGGALYLKEFENLLNRY